MSEYEDRSGYDYRRDITPGSSQTLDKLLAVVCVLAIAIAISWGMSAK